MDEVRKPPLEFADRAIRRFVDNMFGEDVQVIPADFRQMRIVFRRLRGSWEQLSKGDIHHTRLLARIVKSWGKQQEKSRKVEVR